MILVTSIVKAGQYYLYVKKCEFDSILYVYICYFIPEQFTVKAHPVLFEEKGREKLRNTFQRLRLEEFSSGDFGLRSFRCPEISAWAEISDIWGQKLRISKEGREGGGKAREGEGRAEG